MASNPKRPPPRSRPPLPSAGKREDFELPFDEADATPLREDDPAPQRVTQYPSSSSRRSVARTTSDLEATQFDFAREDAELQPSFDPAQASEAQYKPIFLYVERGSGAGQLVQVKQGALVIGRSSVSDLRLQHPSISRRHAQLTRSGERFYLKDLGSQNGTFVNKSKIETELEVHPGAQIDLGNAQLKLRGPLPKTAPEATKAAARKPAPSPAPVKSRLPPESRSMTPLRATGWGNQLLKACGAVALVLLAATFFLWVYRLKPAPRVESAETDTPVVAVEPSRPTVKRLQTRAVLSEATQESVAQPRSAEQLSQVAITPVVEAKTASMTRAVVPPRPATVAEPAVAESDPKPKRAAVLAAYEKGDLAAARELASRAGDKDLTGKLTRFATAFEQANAALEANDGNAAITRFTAALKADEQLSSGWSKYGHDIRQQLSSLWTRVGQQYLDEGDASKAREALAAALKHDPQNSKAKALTEKLPSTAAAATPVVEDESKPSPKHDPPAEKKVVTKRVAPAEKEGEAPAKAARPKADPRAAAIDDAFGE